MSRIKNIRQREITSDRQLPLQDREGKLQGKEG